MENAELAELAVFAAVAKHLSFRQAATDRGTSSSAISHSIRSLEARVGVRLFHRTTRSVSLTEAGEMLYAQLNPALSSMYIVPTTSFTDKDPKLWSVVRGAKISGTWLAWAGRAPPKPAGAAEARARLRRSGGSRCPSSRSRS